MVASKVQVTETFYTFAGIKYSPFQVLLCKIKASEHEENEGNVAKISISILNGYSVFCCNYAT